MINRRTICNIVKSAAATKRYKLISLLHGRKCS